MIGLVDGNNFYVSCERIVNPKLNGKPVAVLSNNDGCCVAMSLEFKEASRPSEPFFEKSSSRILEVTKREDRLDKIARDIAHHFPRRGFLGKGLVVGVDKFTAVKMYDKVQHYWAEEKKQLVKERNEADTREKVRAVIQETLNADLPESYDKPIFDAKTNLLLLHFVDMAVQGYGWISAA